MTGVYRISHVELNSFFSFFLIVHLVSTIGHPIPAKSLSDQSPLQNDSSKYYSILGIPILPFSSSSGSKFLHFSQQNFCARKIISFYRPKKQHRTENNKQGSNKQLNNCLNRFHAFFYLFHCLLWACTFSTVTIKKESKVRNLFKVKNNDTRMRLFTFLHSLF